MPLVITDIRRIEKRTAISGAIPTVAPSGDHTDGTWGPLDIYPGELFLNLTDRKLFSSNGSVIFEFGTVVGPITLSTVLEAGNDTNGHDIVISTADSIRFHDGSNYVELKTAPLTAVRFITFPNKTGTVALTNDFGTMAFQNANTVNIVGGSITGITDLAVADGGTGASTAQGARLNLLPSVVGNELKILRVNAAGTDYELVALAPGGGTATVESVDLSGGTTGLIVTGGPVTTSGVMTLGGVLAISSGGTGATTASGARTNLGLGTMARQNSNLVLISGGTIIGITDLAIADGGTGASTAQAARLNLLPTVVGNELKFLRINAAGTDLEWISVTPGSGTVTSVQATGGTTGLIFTGGPITGAGSLVLSGTLGLANGGTNATTAQGARLNILPSVASNARRLLRVNAAGTDYELFSEVLHTVVTTPYTTSSINSATVPGTLILLSANTIYKVNIHIILQCTVTNIFPVVKMRFSGTLNHLSLQATLRTSINTSAPSSTEVFYFNTGLEEIPVNPVPAINTDIAIDITGIVHTNAAGNWELRTRRDGVVLDPGDFMTFVKCYISFEKIN